MLFFRSEDDVREWCSTRGHPYRPTVRMGQLWELALEWYSTRLQADSRRPQPAEMRRIFSRLGLVDEFWNPQSDAFGAGGSGSRAVT
ncbi:MAG TPA: hypothetical protein VMT70_13465 [Vicinamibacteria bacterium]|nr:hypothetical protein [Vicinamibacteria bacterium]